MKTEDTILFDVAADAMAVYNPHTAWEKMRFEDSSVFSSFSFPALYLRTSGLFSLL